MAPTVSGTHRDFSDRPLADYFWIAGLDSQDLLDAYSINGEEGDSVIAEKHPLSHSVEATIPEDAVAEESAESSTASAWPTKHSRQSSYQRLSILSSEARASIQTLDGLTPISSNRSSATIRRVVSPNHQTTLSSSPETREQDSTQAGIGSLSDADFDNVMKKFLRDRDTFNLDVDFDNDSVTRQSSKSGANQRPRPRTQMIVAEELDSISVPNRTLGSVRRHMSFKDLNSVKRQTSVARRVSTRSARRVSSYNSVMPTPRPLQPTSDEHPLKRSFEPALLDRYPRTSMSNELKRRDPFPDFVPMFAFPNDINIISSDSRPATKWHEFFLTSSDNTKTPAVCIIIWIPLDRKSADALEKRCDEWRKAHMSDAERELAISLGERLAAERAKLSRLLAELPNSESGSEERNELEDEISLVEERISLMSDMLKPLRYGVVNRIDGLMDGDTTGFWIPRAYGIVGKDQCMVSFWKEWLKAIIVPMMDGAVLGVPASSPRVGMWQPLEQYVSIICTQASQPVSSSVQVEVFIRDLRLYAKKEARNELPDSRTLDLYPLFRCLTIPNVIILFEYLLAESRIILVSTYTSVLKLASNALLSLMWPLEWSGVHIPVLPTRLTEVLEAPVPYICGVTRKNDNLCLPQDHDFVMVDLDKNELHATAHPPPLPKQQRRKLMSLLSLAAPHQQTRGVATGPPAYVYEAFPNNMFVSEHPAIFTAITPSRDISRLASLSSTQFGAPAATNNVSRAPLFNAFVQAKPFRPRDAEQQRKSSTIRRPSQTTGSDHISPITATFPPLPTTPKSRNDSGFALQTSLREKRSGHFDSRSKHSPSLSNIRRKGSLPFIRHNASASQASEASNSTGFSSYPSSTYAQSTLAASTIMPGMVYQPVKNSQTTTWIEGHCMQWQSALSGSTCSMCGEYNDEGCYKCSDCPLQTHARCMPQICLPCQAAFYPDQVRVAFARFFTSLFHNYRKFMVPATVSQRKAGLREKLNVDAWIRTLPPEHGEYMMLIKETQAFDCFALERETKSLSESDSVALFDALTAARKARSRGVRSSIAMSLSGRNPFAGRSQSGGVPLEYLSDTSTHIWKVVSTPQNAERVDLGAGAKGREYRKITSRTPAKLEDELFPITTMSHPGNQTTNSKSLRLKMNGLNMHAP